MRSDVFLVETYDCIGSLGRNENIYVLWNKLQLINNFNLLQLNQQQQQKSIMNLNIYKRHKSFFLQAQQKEKLPSKAYSNALIAHRSQELFMQAKRIYQSQANLQKAIEAFDKFLQINPHHDEALYLCGVCEVQLERFQSAVLRFQKISQNYSLKQNSLLLASIAYSKLGHTSKSFELVNQCIKKWPRYEEALCFRGKLQLQMNNFTRAEQDFKNVVAINPHSFLGFIGLGDCSKLGYHYERAIENYQQSLTLLSSSRQPQKINAKEIHLKIGICYYLLQKYEECHYILTNLSASNEMKTSELFYYLGLTELVLNNREKGLNHLQYAIRLETSPHFIEKSYKKLILLYLQNYQFYEAQTVSKLCDVYKMNAKLWKQLIESFMLVIRNQYQVGLESLNKIYNAIKGDKHSINQLKITDKDKKIDEFIFKTEHASNLFRRKGSTLRSEKRIKSHKKSLDKPLSIERKQQLFRINKSIDKIQSLRLNSKNYQSFPLNFGRFKTEYQEPEFQPIAPAFTQKEKEILLPIILRFKAYCEFFTDKMISCSQSLEQYELYIQDLFGKESDVKFSKTICEILMLVESDELEEALLKCNEAINIHVDKYGCDNVQPMLYKIAILIRMAIVSILNGQDQKEESYEILMLTLEMIDEKVILKNHPLTHYFSGIIYILTDDHRNGQLCLEAASKLAETSTSSMLYMKGLVQLKLGNYLLAFKDMSASLIVKKSDRAYLARSLILFYISEDKELLKQDIAKLVLKSLDSLLPITEITKNTNLVIIRQCIVEKCLDDLQNYIDLCENDEDITAWVTKILFACRSYDEVTAAIQKVTSESTEMNKISKCLSIYNGDFERGGKVGLTIKSALDGAFLSEEQELHLLKIPLVKDYSNEEYDYLDAKYQKWLVLLQLYMRQQYQLCIKYTQKLIFESQRQQDELILRYNLAFIYFLTEEYEKGVHLVKSLAKFQEAYPLKSLIEKIMGGDFVKDECLSDLTQYLHLRASKMLSNYLPYKSIFLLHDSTKIMVYGRINIPFPAFPKPNLNLDFDIQFILSELDLNKIPKYLQAPWIKRSNRSIQFTDSMQETINEFESHKEESLSLPLKNIQSKQYEERILS